MPVCVNTVNKLINTMWSFVSVCPLSICCPSVRYTFRTHRRRSPRSKCCCVVFFYGHDVFVHSSVSSIRMNGSASTFICFGYLYGVDSLGQVRQWGSEKNKPQNHSFTFRRLKVELEQSAWTEKHTLLENPEKNAFMSKCFWVLCDTSSPPPPTLGLIQKRPLLDNATCGLICIFSRFMFKLSY